MKASSLKFLFAVLGFVACVAMTSGCNKGYGCPADFHADARTDIPAATLPSC